MTVFKYFFKILKQYKFLVIMYTAILIFFAAFSLQTNESSISFTAEKPDVFIVNKDDDTKITNNLVNYIKENANIKDIENTEDKINDAIFYRDVNYVIYIPKDYHEDFLSGNNPNIEVKSTGDYNASYMEMLLKRYIKVANSYQEIGISEEDIVAKINETLKNNVDIEITSKLDTSILSKASFYYNFLNYSMLATCVFIVATIMCSFKDKNIKRRTNISSIKYTKFNRELFLANLVFTVILWIVYVLISFILIKDAMISDRGIYYIINSFIFMVCSLSIAFLISNLVTSKNAINGIVNVLALGSSFLCGAFVPVEWLPNSVLKIAHVLPSYWYIQNNELLKNIETININTLKPYITNILVILLFLILFTIFTNIISKLKRREK